MGRFPLRWLTALGLLGGLTLAAAAHAASPVWAIKGPHNTVYLAGSVHLLPAKDAALPAGFERAYADSRRLVMELDLAKTDPLVIAGWLTQHGALPQGSTLKSVIGETRYTRVAAAAAELGLSAQMLDGQAPWVVGLELADLQYVHQGFDPTQGVEEQLLRRAAADGKETGGLETLDEELGGLESLSRENQIKLLDQTLDDLKEPPEELNEVVDAWRAGDAGKLAQLLSQEYDGFPALYQPLVTARNQHWLPQIEQLVKNGQNCLVVVGALHLVGEGGLLQLLRKDGYTATQLN
jgi:uncharacterized protein